MPKFYLNTNLHLLDGDFLEMSLTINSLYKSTEEGIWKPEKQRTDPAELRTLFNLGQLIIAKIDSQVCGFVKIHKLNNKLEFGMLVSYPKFQKQGIGSSIIRFVEEYAKSLGCTHTSFELICPRNHDLQSRKLLRDWYTSLGYNNLGTRIKVDEVIPQFNHLLETECDFEQWDKLISI